MARFRYLGEPPNPAIQIMGPTLQIRCRCKDGTILVYDPVPPAVEFAAGLDIGYDVTEERSLRHLRVDTRFQEIV
jgi:hypothetical protein